MNREYVSSLQAGKLETLAGFHTELKAQPRLDTD